MGNRKRAKRPSLRLRRTQVPELGPAAQVTAPSDEKVVIKEVPAKVDGTVVGTAFIYEDGSIDFTIDDDAPQWAKDKIETTRMDSYSIGTDEL